MCHKINAIMELGINKDDSFLSGQGQRIIRVTKWRMGESILVGNCNWNQQEMVFP
jgi:hypothetical protein